jgi:thymidylate synthase
MTRVPTDRRSATSELEFEALYHRDQLHPVNPRGDVGLLTLWSPYPTVERKLREIAPELLDPERSRIAVVANLYGDGMLAMFCNLLFNPQIRHLVAIGEDLGLSTRQEIELFLEHGLEEAEMLGAAVKRVPGTERVFPPLPNFDPQALRARLSFRYLGKLSRPDLETALVEAMGSLPTGPSARREDRVRVEIPAAPAADSYKPSAATGHQVVRAGPLDCWQELVVRTIRFGRPVTLRKGTRLELLNVKAVITDPRVESREALSEFGFDLDRFRRYQRAILEPELPEDVDYTYGNRLRGYFRLRDGSTDALAAAIELLREDPETRQAYVGLWDPTRDLGPGGDSKPCLTTVFFRRLEGRLTLAATYRSHNLLWAWPENVYGLMAIQGHVAERVGMKPGPITVLSNSLGINPESPRYELARAIEGSWKTDDDLDRETGKYSLREDPHGYFVVTVDQERGLIVAEHRFGGVLLKRYEAERAVTIEREVATDMAVSLVSHAMWLGRELTLKERVLRGSAAGRGGGDG